MFALLGDIQFDLITYFEGFESRFGADFAEHALITGKPRLQFIGDKLDEITITLAFHQYFCDPERELVRLKKAIVAHQAMALVLGNGDYKGCFVLTDVTATSKQTDPSGTLVELGASITLREYVGDKNHPLPPPAVQPKRPPAMAQRSPALPASPTGAVGATNTARDNIRSAVTLASQAQSTMRVAVDASNLARKLNNHPLAAMGRVPGLLTNLNQAAVPLAKLSPTLAKLSTQLPETASILRASTKALNSVHNAQGALSGVHAGSVTSRIDYMAAQLGTATGALDSAAPGISKLAGNIVTRTI